MIVFLALVLARLCQESSYMLKNYFITALRNLSRNRSFTIINVFGLALGISAALVLFKIVLFEKSFDKNFSNYDRIYRVIKKVTSASAEELEAGVQNPFAESFRTDYPDFATVVRAFYSGDGQVSTQDVSGAWQHFEESEGIAFVDHDFLKVFDLEWVVGNPETALTEPKMVVLTESLATKYFGIDDSGFDRALGMSIKLDNELLLTVSGVVKDLPENTSFPFTMFVEYEGLDGFWDFYQPDSWGSTASNAHVFMLLNEGITPEQVEEVFPAFVEKYITEGNSSTVFQLQPLANVHFQPEYNTFGSTAINSQQLLAPAIIGVFLILTACINFVNLSTALAIKRSKEVGVRKVLGGKRGQLVFQFLSETFLITLFAVLISMGLAELILTNLGDLVGYSLSLDLLNDPQLLAIVSAVVVGVTFLAGLYPSIILSRLNLVSVLRSKGQVAMSGNINTRRGLVVFQFLISQILVICTLVVINQMNYFESKDLGFRKSSIVTFPLPSREPEKLQLMRNQLMEFAGVNDVSYGFSSPLSQSNIGSTFNYAPLESEADFDAAYKVIDEHYLNLYDIKLLAGRDISVNDTSMAEAIVSERVLQVMGIDDPQDAIGKSIQTGFGDDKQIVGVFNDFHNRNLKNGMEPIIMVRFPGYFYEGAVLYEGSEKQFSQMINKLQTAWTNQFPDVIFDYDVLSDEIMENYEDEANMLTLFQAFSGIAILIGCLGLYGLVSFMANQKTKEIGIRKVLGASISQILRIFTRELMLLIGIAFLLAIPLGYYFMDSWLSDFEYRIDLSVWVFAVAVGFTFVIAAITTGIRSLKAANANPVDSLRSE